MVQLMDINACKSRTIWQNFGKIIAFIWIVTRLTYMNAGSSSSHSRVIVFISLCDFLFSLQEADEAGMELKAVDVFLPEQKRIFAQLLLDYRKTLIDHVNKVRRCYGVYVGYMGLIAYIICT